MRLVALQRMGQQARHRGHVLLVVVPGALDVDRRLEALRVEALVVGAAHALTLAWPEDSGGVAR